MNGSTIAGIAAGISGLLGLVGFVVFAIYHLNSRLAAKAQTTPEVINALKGSNIADYKDLSPSVARAILEKETELSNSIINALISPSYRNQEKIAMFSTIGFFFIAIFCLLLWRTIPSAQQPPNSEDTAIAETISPQESERPVAGTIVQQPTHPAVAALAEFDIDRTVSGFGLSAMEKPVAIDLVQQVLQTDSALTQLLVSDQVYDIALDAAHAVCFLVPYLPERSTAHTLSLVDLDIAISEAIPDLRYITDRHTQNVSRQVQTLLKLLGDSATASALESWASGKAGDGKVTPGQYTPSADTRIVFVSSSEGDDSFDGLSPSRPKKSLRAALEVARIGKPDWIVLKRGDVFRAEGRLPRIAGRGPGEEMIVGAYGGDGNGDIRDPILIIPDTRNSDWPDSNYAIVVAIEIIR